MTFPTGTVIPTTNVASPSSDPSLARVNLYDLIVAFNQLIDSYNAAQGVLVLDGSAKVSSTYLPSSYSITGSLSLQPSTGITSLNAILRLPQIVSADLGSANGTTSPSAGDVCYLTDGDAGRPCLGVYNGSAWKVLRLMTTVGSVGAAVTARFTLTAAAT
jgi:hypothetical protein